MRHHLIPVMKLGGTCFTGSLWILLWTALGATLFIEIAKATPVVDTNSGKLRGVTVNNVLGGTYEAFRGIPYAKPPQGSLRFADPIPAASWKGVRNASEFSDDCVQKSKNTGEIVGSEDCLYLNVYTKKKIIESGRKVAVMFWIFGGAFRTGSGDDDSYGADFLLRKDIVLVTINYRLQVFGFLSLEDEVAPGNQGLKDQLLALKWVQRNIAKFGGDPDNVTIFGESSGSASVHFLAVSPAAQGLFHKVIMESGVIPNPWALKLSPRKTAVRLAKVLGKESSDSKEIVDFLRSIDSGTLLNATEALITVERYLADMPFIFYPTVDDKSKNPIVPRPIEEAVRAGINVPVIIGFNDREGLFFVPDYHKDPHKLEQINERFTEIYTPEIIPILKDYGVSGEQLRKHYLGNATLNNDTFPRYVDLLSDVNFIRGIYDIARLQVQVRPDVPTYFYEFSNRYGVSLYKRRNNIRLKGTSHSDELVTLFYPNSAKNMTAELISPGSAHYKKILIMTQMWTDFAICGNPTPKRSDEAPVIWDRLEEGPYLNLLHIDDPPKMIFDKVIENRIQWERCQRYS